MGSWNILSLFRPGALQTVAAVLDKYKIHVAAIQEVRWVGEDSTKSGKYTLLYSGRKDNRHEEGTGFMVHDSITPNIIDFAAINSRICRLRIKGTFQNISLVCAYAPTEDKEETIKDDFYDILETVCQDIPKNDIRIVLGDLNAKVGREAIYYPIIGKHSLHAESNDNGKKLIDFASHNNLTVSSTSFPHKNIHKATWQSNDGFTKNQIDHLLIGKERRSNVLDVRSYRGADCDSDHYLLIGVIRQKVSMEKSRNLKKERCRMVKSLKTQARPRVLKEKWKKTYN